MSRGARKKVGDKGRIALEETFKRFPEWEVDHDGVVPLFTSTVRGYTKVPISV